MRATSIGTMRYLFFGVGLVGGLILLLAGETLIGGLLVAMAAVRLVLLVSMQRRMQPSPSPSRVNWAEKLVRDTPTMLAGTGSGAT